ncbi:MAG: UDP-N-acetylmuramoyl-tripeptide--D-alanyl-D-alanine ligase [Candidatus Moraniibacteriota bacterium]
MALPERLKLKFAAGLGFLARLVLKVRRPIIVGITGSVGKSSAKEAIALVLARKYQVRFSPGNYNNEFGLPAAILGIPSPGRSLTRWCGAVAHSLAIVLRFESYPEVLVLEMGIDHPGDMDYLLTVARPDVAVLTRIAESHLANFENLAHIAKEKGKLIAALPETGSAILNADDERVMKQGERTRAKIISYGLTPSASLSADNIRLLQESGRVDGLSFKLNSGGKSIPVRLPRVIAHHHLSAVLAAAAVGVTLKMNLVDIAAALVEFKPLTGRMNLLTGEAGMRIIDDSYNASKISTEAALATLRELIAPRKVIILGDMLEIGPNSNEAHRSLRDAVVSSGATVFIGVGQHMRYLADALRGGNFPEKGIYHFLDPMAALDQISDIVRSGDLVLIKGSQGLRMELIVLRLLGERDDSEKQHLLCRQSVNWQSTPFTPPAEWQ